MNNRVNGTWTQLAVACYLRHRTRVVFTRSWCNFKNIADPKVQSLNGFYGKEREVRLEISILELPCFEGIVNTDRHQIS